MQDDTLNGRDILLEELRESARQNEQNMRGSVSSYRRTYPDQAPEIEEVPHRYSTFVLRLLLCVFIFGVFLWSHLGGQTILGYNTENVVETISRDADLQEITNSVRIRP